MEIRQENITIRELIKGYENKGYDGVVAYEKKLDVRPPYQRNFVYDYKQKAAVIDSVMKGLPLNIMYWADREDGTFEVIDGQQRTISVCDFAQGVFSVEMDNDLLGFTNLSDEKQKQFLDYKLLIYVCKGTDDEKLSWFRTINIAGERLEEQELRNAVYYGPWLSNAKFWFSRRNCPAQILGSHYLKADVERQGYLEKSLEWISTNQEIDIREYMRIHQFDDNAKELWDYYEGIITWIESLFPKKRRGMDSVNWGKLYSKYSDKEYTEKEKQDIAKLTAKLYKDPEVKNKSGIYEYIFTGKSNLLNLRQFSDDLKISVYEQKNGICAHCKEYFPIEKVHADHIKPWSLGGQTIITNCQILCQSCNAKKSDNY